MWSCSAARMESPHAISPLLIYATAMTNAASFSRTVPKSGMIFTVSPLAQGVMRGAYNGPTNTLIRCGSFATLHCCQSTEKLGIAAEEGKITEPPYANCEGVPRGVGSLSQISC